MLQYSINGISLKVSEHLVTEPLREKLASGTYEGAEARAVKHCVRRGDRVLDLGAGLGYISVLCGRVTGGSNIVAVEAHPELVEFIQINLKDNGVSNAAVLHCAVVEQTTSEETVLFHKAPAFWASALADENSKRKRLTKVLGVSIKDLLAEYAPNVVVMDIEGAEKFSFNDPWPDNVRHVLIELHPKQYPPEIIKRIFDCMAASGLIYDTSVSNGAVVMFSRMSNP